MSSTSAEESPPVPDGVLLDGLFGAECAGGEGGCSTRFKPRVRGSGAEGGGDGWQWVRKGGHLLVMAPAERGALARGLRWYRALRPAGKAYRAALSGVSRSPCWRFLPVKRIAAVEGGLIRRIEESGGRRVGAVLFGNPVQRRRRVILSVEGNDGTAWVVKAGFTAESMAAIDRERRNLERLRGKVPGVPRVLEVWQAEGLSGFATMELAGEALKDPLAGLAGAVDLLREWTRFDEIGELRQRDAWNRVEEGWHGGATGWRERIGRVKLAGAVGHGDYAAWNLLVDGGRLRAVDWELAELEGVAGWDIVHFLCQHFAMVKRLEGGRLVRATLESLGREPVAGFLKDCGWPGPEAAFATYAAALNPIFRGPKGEALRDLCARAEAR